MSGCCTCQACPHESAAGCWVSKCACCGLLAHATGAPLVPREVLEGKRRLAQARRLAIQREREEPNFPTATDDVDEGGQ